MKKYSLKKRVIFSIILVVFSLAFLEIAIHLFYLALKQEIFPLSAYNKAISKIAKQHSNFQKSKKTVAGELNVISEHHVETIHPYLGFVRDPDKTPDTSFLGFPGAPGNPFKRYNNRLTRLAIFGGSFAEGVSNTERSNMIKKLKKKGINTEIFTFALGGYKQPQQLMSLVYLLSHGAKFDIVLNIDGFNEVALPQAENLPKGVNPFYPRDWYFRTIQINDQNSLRIMGRVLIWSDERRQWAKWFENLSSLSILSNIIWKTRDRILERKIWNAINQMRLSEPELKNRFIVTGPEFEFHTTEDLYVKIAEHWKACSLLMNAVCVSHGISYIHMLQPNQYFESGKVLTLEERTSAYRADHPYRPGVVKGYPKLLEQSGNLLERGIDFHDLTMIYNETNQTIYKDDCCHPNKLGYEIVSDYIIEAVVSSIHSKGVNQHAN